MSRTNKLFFAVAKGKVSSEGGEIKRYIGVAPVFVLAVNPDKKKLEELYNTTIENGPVYIGETEVGENKKKVAQVRLDFIVKTDGNVCKDTQGNPIEALTRVSFFIRNQYRTNSAGDKIQVIDKYGRTAWVTKEEFQSKSLPSYMNGNKFKLDSDYRAVLWGEPELVEFIRTYLCINKPEKWNNGQIVGLVDNLEECELSFEHMQDWFKGDVSELSEIISYQPNNKVKVLFGVRTTDNNKQYQAIYTQMFLRANVTNYAKLEKDVQDRKNVGAYPTTEFKVCDLKVYQTSATDFSNTPEEDMPDFTSAPANPWGNN